MSLTEFVPLHCHSYYSLLDGMVSPDQISATAAEYGHRACALTDHGTCGGLFSFQKACEKREIKPILGMEAYFVDDVWRKEKGDQKSHINLLAKNAVGYKNLINLSTMGYTKGFYSKPRIDMKMLEAHKEGLIVLSACAGGILCKPFINNEPEKARELAGQFKDVFGEDFYMEIMEHIYHPDFVEKANSFVDSMKKVYQLSQDMGVVPVYTYDSHYCQASDSKAHDVLLSISTRNTIKNPNRFSYRSDDFYMKSPQELAERLKGHEELLSNTLQVSEKIEGGLISPSAALLPMFDLPPGVPDSETYLKQLIRDGMIQKGLFQKQEYRDRITVELGVIISCGFTKYFLVLWDIIMHAKREGIRLGPGRGSGVASLCLYCLGVTALDPIKYDLLFSRFLNPDRVSPPDVDLDFDYEYQDEMFRYVSSKYGEECTTRIGTYGSLKAKDAIKRVGKALDIGKDWEMRSEGSGKWKSGKNTLNIVNLISKSIPNSPDMTIQKALDESPETAAYQRQYPEVFEMAKKVEGSLSSAGVHPAGIIVCNQPVRDLVPLRVTNKVLCTQFDMHQVEEMGLLKFDFLALKTLTVIEHCVKLIEERHGRTIDMDKLEPSDPNVFSLFNKDIDPLTGRVTKDPDVEGIFQFEGRGISETLASIRADSFDDMIVGVALFRPGPMDNIPDFCDYKHKRKPINYLHPIMKELLQDTHGMMCYQEQVMAMSMKMAGFTAAEADKFRKGMGKKNPALLASMKGKFLEGSSKNGVSTQVSTEVFELCEKFAGYGFNKSHAAAYAYLAYQTAWLKMYYRPEFMAALLSQACSPQDVDKKVRYERNSEKHGIKILPFDINKSGGKYTIEENSGKISLRRPLSAMKGIGGAAVGKISSKQPFADLVDFVRQTSRHINSAAFGFLADSGCMRAWGSDPETLKTQFDNIRKKVRKEEKTKQSFDQFEGGFITF